MTKEGREVARVDVRSIPRLVGGEDVWIASFAVVDPGNVGEMWTATADTAEEAAYNLKDALARDASRIAGYLGVVDAYERGETDV